MTAHRLAWLLVAALPIAQAQTVALSGELTVVGSDTASGLMAHAADAFAARHPAVRVQLQSMGSASAPAALTEGAADIGAMSRAMLPDEEQAFVRRWGYPPTRFLVAHDAIAVIVHPDNPIPSLSLAQVDAIYSDTLRCGAAAPIADWNDIAPSTRAPGSRPILAIGRDAGSGTHERFRQVALCGGAYRADVVAWPGNGRIVASVMENPHAIGYVGTGYLNGVVRAVPLAATAQDAPAEPDAANIAAGRYALSRAVYVYVNRPEGRALPRQVAAFVAVLLSDDEQALVGGTGLVSLTPDERRSQRMLLGQAAHLQ